jgi:hypothetical protein
MLDNMPAASDTIKKIYCQWNYKKCARFRVASALGREKVPLDLFPGDAQRATNILIQHESR